MKWTELVAAVAAKTGQPEKVVRDVMNTAMGLAIERAVAGGEVTLKGIGVLASRWRKPRAVRSVVDQRKVMLGGRHVPLVRISRSLKARMADRSPQTWRNPEFQQAWRMAETLVGDLDLYHPDRKPSIPLEANDEAVLSLCQQSFGGLWRRVVRTWDKEIPAALRDRLQATGAPSLLAQAARAQWPAE